MARPPGVRNLSRSTPIALTLIGGVLTSLVAYGSVRGRWALPPYEPATAAPDAGPAGSPVRSIVLPHDEPLLPPGPHRNEFLAQCTLCHSPLLVTTQPSLPREKWGEEVHKMVTSYGAPVAVDQEPRIVDYLMVIRGR